MPQVAQQDYIRIASKVGRDIYSDANVMAQIAGSLEKGTIFDILFQDGLYDSLHRVLMVKKVYDSKFVYFIDGRQGVLAHIGIDFTATQYEGLAAIQMAEDEKRGVTTLTFPAITIDENDYLLDDEQGMMVCVDNQLIRAVLDEDNAKIVDLVLTDEPATGDWVNITWEDAQKLIGLPIA